MNVTISARHCEIPDSLRAATATRISRLERYHPRLTDAEVTFDMERTTHNAEIRLVVEGEPPVIGRASEDSFQAALDRGVDRVLRQLRRGRERRVARRHTTTVE